jgi:hypothetical protein
MTEGVGPDAWRTVKMSKELVEQLRRLSDPVQLQVIETSSGELELRSVVHTCQEAEDARVLGRTGERIRCAARIRHLAAAWQMKEGEYTGKDFAHHLESFAEKVEQP